jgi:eukaryotic-like serine/threonine-protein kinase
MGSKDRQIKNCRIVAFRSAKERRFRGAKGDTRSRVGRRGNLQSPCVSRADCKSAVPQWLLTVLAAVFWFFAAWLFSAAALGGDAWPAQRGTAAGAASANWPSAATDFQDWTFRGRPKQVFRSGVPVWASPALAVIEGRPLLLIGGCDQTIYALDLASRRRLWFKVTNGCICDAPVVGEAGSRQIVFFGSSDRFVSAHAALDGELLWTRELVPPTSTQTEAEVSSPFYDDGVLYVAWFVYDKALATNRQDSILTAFDAATGRLLWQREVGHGPTIAPIGCRIDGELFLFVAARKGRLQAFRASREGVAGVWEFQSPHEVLGSPSISAAGSDAPTLFLGSKFGDLIALNAKSGRQRWRRMTGNWVDNSACCGLVGARQVVFVGSNDYSLYALDAGDGNLLWRRPLGGEVYSAPCLFRLEDRPLVAVACLDNRLYVIDAESGAIHATFYTGPPVWDKLSKGETLWGSPVALTAPGSAAIVHGSYDGNVYLLPLDGKSRFAVQSPGSRGPWIGLAIVGLALVALVLPCVLILPRRPDSAPSGKQPL